MGLLTGIITLPLAPVRATVWLAEQVADVAEQELGNETSLRRRMAEAEIAYELGQIELAEYESIEDDLLARIDELRDPPALEAAP